MDYFFFFSLVCLFFLSVTVCLNEVQKQQRIIINLPDFLIAFFGQCERSDKETPLLDIFLYYSAQVLFIIKSIF